MDYRDVRVDFTEHADRVMTGEASALDLLDRDEWVFNVRLDAAAGRCWVNEDGVLAATRCSRSG